jgi:hypothetical protein
MTDTLLTVSLAERHPALTAVVLAFFGAWVVSVLIRVERPLPRVEYFFAVAVLWLIPTLLSLLITGVDDGELPATPVLAASALGAFVYGLGLYLVSAMRALDAFGRPRLGWLGLVPIANLVLHVKRGKNPAPELRFGMNKKEFEPTFLILGCLLLVVANVLPRLTWDQGGLLLRTSSGERLAETVSARFAQEIAQNRPQLPLRIDHLTTFVDISSDGRTMTYVYELDHHVELGEMLIDNITGVVCPDTGYAADFELGGQLSYEYWSPGRADPQVFLITQDVCTEHGF